MFNRHAIVEMVDKVMDVFRRAIGKKKTVKSIHERQSEIMKKKYGP